MKKKVLDEWKKIREMDYWTLYSLRGQQKLDKVRNLLETTQTVARDGQTLSEALARLQGRIEGIKEMQRLPVDIQKELEKEAG